ncbi:hypothetical protein [Spiroplasma endosymbiont of Othius punctulatus]|uniref:hypothetical protein n=1 Tax=Spiroplasma endosymbiont of Othius punctulatus TaxID=3066289 RepID=UPI0030D11130
MPKDTKNFIYISDLDDKSRENINKLLQDKKTLVMALEVGDNVKKSLDKGFSDFLNANMELKEYKDNIGVCSCGEPNNALIYLWKD